MVEFIWQNGDGNYRRRISIRADLIIAVERGLYEGYEYSEGDVQHSVLRVLAGPVVILFEVEGSYEEVVCKVNNALGA